MRQINIVLDLYSIAVSLILILYLLVKGKWQGRLNLYFTLMCVFNLGMLLGDLTNWTCEGLTQPWFPFVLRAGTVVYFGCSAPLLLVFAGYIIEYLTHRITVPRWVWYLVCVLTGIQLSLSVLSVWTGSYFTFTENNNYVRGNYFWLSQFIPFLIYIVNVMMIVRYRDYMQKKDVSFLLFYVVVLFIAEAIQMTNYGIALMNTGTTLVLLLVFINIQLELELVIGRQEAELAESRIDIMLSQIQPHFLYNTLTTIRQLCDSEPMAAKEALRDFSHFLRANMSSLTNKAPIPFAQELSHVEHYLNLEKQRFRERLCVVYDIQTKDFKIPPLTLQPIVENAVRHGIMMREEGGTVTIRTSETASAYIVTVYDDGIGFDAATALLSDGSQVGLANVENRLRMMCGGTLEIKSVPGAGTTVTLSISREEEIHAFSSGG